MNQVSHVVENRLAKVLDLLTEFAGDRNFVLQRVPFAGQANHVSGQTPYSGGLGLVGTRIDRSGRRLRCTLGLTRSLGVAQGRGDRARKLFDLGPQSNPA